MVNMHISHKH